VTTLCRFTFVTFLIASYVPKVLVCERCPTTRHGGTWGEGRYRSYSFSNSTLGGGELSASHPGRALAPGKGLPVPIFQEVGWAPNPVWPQRLEEKSFHLCRGSNFDCPVVQPVARHCTDWATRITLVCDSSLKKHASLLSVVLSLNNSSVRLLRTSFLCNNALVLQNVTRLTDDFKCRNF
jgi:hypothetical protein